LAAQHLPTIRRNPRSPAGSESAALRFAGSWQLERRGNGQTGQRPFYRFTLADPDELAGYVAAEANHARVKKLEKQLRQLCQADERSLPESSR
jgi:hypothetical protein